MSDSSDISRRDFLAASCVVCGAGPYLLADERQSHLDYVGAEDAAPIERFVNTVCPMCPGGCGVRVRVVHECAVGVRGNPSHPINRGGLCARGSAVLQELYHPERLLKPQQRVGSRGADQWQPIEWPDAIGQVVEKLTAVRTDPGPHALLTLLGRDRGLTRTAWQRFMRAFGSPNLIQTSPEANMSGLPAIRATHGLEERIGYDLARSAYVLSFSSQWLDSHWSATQASRAYAEFRRSRPGLRPRWVHLEPRLSLTAAKANEWIQIRPGTDGAVALAIAHVIVREGLYDREFVSQHCHGFEDWRDAQGNERPGFRKLVLQEYPPSRVEETTGVPESTIFRVAREFCQHRPAVAIGYDEGGCGTQRCYDRMAIHCLNALAGSIDVPGGVTVFRELALLKDEVHLDETARRGLERPRLDGPTTLRRLGSSAADQLPAAILQSVPYQTHAVFLVDSNPAFTSPEGERFVEALLRVPFVVSFADFVDDTNRFADLILPGLHGLERWDLDLTHTLGGHPVFSVAQPVVTPPPGTRHPYDVVRAVAAGLGGSMAACLPWESPQVAVTAAARELFEGGRGATFGPAHEETWAQLLESRGWRAPFAATFEDFWDDLLGGGGWTDPIYFHQEWDRVFKAPARQFAFHSQVLERSFAAAPPPSGERTDLLAMPHQESLPSDPGKRFPLQLYVYTLPTLAYMDRGNLPWLNTVSGSHMLRTWDSWVEMHPETAEHYGIEDNEGVVVTTPRGALELRAKIFAGVMPGVLAIPFGFGHEGGGRWVAREGGNPARIVMPLHDPLSGTSFWNGTHASLAKL